MHSLGKVTVLAAWNLRCVCKNPRFFLCAAMAFLLCFLLSDHVTAAARHYQTDLQLLELFIWCFSDSDSIFFAALALMLLLSPLPDLGPFCAYQLLRVNRGAWLLAQVLTMAMATALYMLVLLFSCVLLGMDVSFGANRWSETAMLLSYMPAGSDIPVTVVRRAIRDTTPYGCALQIFLLLQAYMLLLSMLQLAATLFRSRSAGMLLVLSTNLLGYALTPARFITWLQLDSHAQYVANLLSAWLSPLQHATYAMHSFGYDNLPALWQSHAIMLALSLILGIAAYRLFRTYPCNFHGGDDVE